MTFTRKRISAGVLAFSLVALAISSSTPTEGVAGPEKSDLCPIAPAGVTSSPCPCEPYATHPAPPLVTEAQATDDAPFVPEPVHHADLEVPAVPAFEPPAAPIIEVFAPVEPIDLPPAEPAPMPPAVVSEQVPAIPPAEVQPVADSYPAPVEPQPAPPQVYSPPPPPPMPEVPVVEASAEPAPDAVPLRVLMRFGDGPPRYEIKTGDELLLKVYGDRMELTADSAMHEGTLPPINAVGSVRFFGPGVSGTCDQLSIISSHGEVLLRGNVQMKVKKGSTPYHELAAEEVLFQVGGTGVISSEVRGSTNAVVPATYRP